MYNTFRHGKSEWTMQQKMTTEDLYRDWLQRWKLVPAVTHHGVAFQVDHVQIWREPFQEPPAPAICKAMALDNIYFVYLRTGPRHPSYISSFL